MPGIVRTARQAVASQRHGATEANAVRQRGSLSPRFRIRLLIAGDSRDSFPDRQVRARGSPGSALGGDDLGQVARSRRRKTGRARASARVRARAGSWGRPSASQASRAPARSVGGRVGIGPADAVVDRLGGPSSAQGDHRGLAGEGLDRDDPEILLAGEEQGPASPVVVADHLVGLPAEELGPRARPAAPAGPAPGPTPITTSRRPDAEQAATAWSRFLYGTRAETQR